MSVERQHGSGQDKVIARVTMSEIVAHPEPLKRPETLFSLTRNAQHVDITGGSLIEQGGALDGVVRERVRFAPRGKALVIDLGNSGITRQLVSYSFEDSKLPVSVDISHGGILSLVPPGKRAGVLVDAMGGTEEERTQREGMLKTIEKVFLNSPYPATYEGDRLSPIDQFIQGVRYLRSLGTQGLTREQKESLGREITEEERAAGLVTKVLFDLDSWFKTLTEGDPKSRVESLDLLEAEEDLVILKVDHPKKAAGRILTSSLESIFGGDYGTVAILGAEWLPVEDSARLRLKAARKGTKTVYLYNGGPMSDEIYEQIGTDTHVIMGEGNAARAKKIADFVIGIRPIVVGGYSVATSSADATTYSDGEHDQFHTAAEYAVGRGDSRGIVENVSVTGGVTADQRIDPTAYTLHPDAVQHLFNMAAVLNRSKRELQVVPLFPGVGLEERALPPAPVMITPRDVSDGHRRAQEDLAAITAGNEQKVIDGRTHRPELDRWQAEQEEAYLWTRYQEYVHTMRQRRQRYYGWGEWRALYRQQFGR